MSTTPVQKHYVDIETVSEIFADGVHALFFDGRTFRFEFSVSRLDQANPPGPPTMKEHPACRLVLPPEAAIDLLNKLNQLASMLEQQGALKKTQVTTPPTPTVAH